MRTLKNGKEVKYYAICPECSSHLEYGYEDFHKGGGAESGSRYIVCPVCDERIKIKSPTQTTPLNIGWPASALNACCTTTQS